MNMHEFGVAAKRAVVQVMREEYGLEVEFDDLILLWFDNGKHAKRCTIWGDRKDGYYAEAEYDAGSEHICVDLFRRSHRAVVPVGDLM